MRVSARTFAVRAVLAAVVALSAPFPASASVPPRLASSRLPDMERRVLAMHNLARAARGIAPLRWNPALAAGAALWAGDLARRGVFEHSRHLDGVGENLWAGTPGAFSLEHMVGRWVAERQLFKPGVFPDNSMTGHWKQVGHYTQIMWRSTTSVGCAIAHGWRADVLVCRYAPAGNVYGEMPF